jgi:prevent-host-death family protein
MKVRRMGSRELRVKIGSRIDAARRGEPTVITRNGQPEAVLVSYAEWAAARPGADEPRGLLPQP